MLEGLKEESRSFKYASNDTIVRTAEITSQKPLPLQCVVCQPDKYGLYHF